MADLAKERYMLIDDSSKNSVGEKILKVLPWESVVYTNGANEKIGGLEMTSTGGHGTRNLGDREIRGIEFINTHKFAALHNTDGQSALPTG